MDNFIYLIERHQGDHDDYRVTSVKAYENKLEAIVFVNLCNLDIEPMLEKMEEFDEVYNVGIHAFQEKFDYDVVEMRDNEEHNKWQEKMNDEYNEILATFKHEDLEFADAPIKYKIKKIKLVKKGF